jgi:hypothetical protein
MLILSEDEPRKFLTWLKQMDFGMQICNGGGGDKVKRFWIISESVKQILNNKVISSLYIKQLQYF